MNMLGLCQVYISHIWHVIEISSFYNIYKSSVSPGFAMQIMLILFSLCYNDSLVTWTVVSLTAPKFKPYILCVRLRLVLWSEHVRSHDFVWPLLVACTILLYNRIHTEGWKPYANREPVCTLDHFQWCGEPCFADTAILREGVCRKFPGGKSISNYWSNQCFMEG
jgi:hypothetical protein